MSSAYEEGKRRARRGEQANTLGENLFGNNKDRKERERGHNRERTQIVREHERDRRHKK